MVAKQTLLSCPDICVLFKMPTKKKMSERDVKIHFFSLYKMNLMPNQCASTNVIILKKRWTKLYIGFQQYSASKIVKRPLCILIGKTRLHSNTHTY